MDTLKIGSCITFISKPSISTPNLTTMLSLASRRLNTLRSTAVRAYSDSRVAGATATSREFSKKEKAHEDQYVRQKEVADLEKLRKKLADHQKELEKLSKQVEDHVNNKK